VLCCKSALSKTGGSVGKPAERAGFPTKNAMKLEDRIREVMRFKHYSIRTEESYVGWYKQFVRFHKMRHPAEMGAPEVEAFLTHLAVDRRVVAATQNQGLNALVFLYKAVLEKEFEGVDAMRAQQSKLLPVEETRKLLMV
jgi:hypothetical protein